MARQAARRTTRILDSELIVDFTRLEALAPEWEALAVAAGLPQTAPAWVLAWWRHLAPEGAQLRAVAVRDRDALVGFAPFYVTRDRRRTDYRLPGIELAPRLSPLASSGCEWEVAAAISSALATARPRADLIALEAHPASSPWPLALRRGWPGAARPRLAQYVVQDSPTISLAGGSYERWLAGSSSNFRGQMGRVRRRFLAEGGSARISTSATVEADIESFIGLHRLRWEGRGASKIIDIAGRLPAMLLDIANLELDGGGFRLWILEVGGAPISAQLFFAIGGEVVYVNGGWDERFARLKPAMLGILYSIEDAFERGERRIDLGGGDQPYKLRFADGNDPLVWSVLVVPGIRSPLTRASTAPMLASHAFKDRMKRTLTPRQLDRLRSVRRRVTSE
ncbi:MAG: GNAT family N-acetyltransferase [Solirubrobacteraceae bacterium]